MNWRHVQGSALLAALLLAGCGNIDTDQGLRNGTSPPAAASAGAGSASDAATTVTITATTADEDLTTTPGAVEAVTLSVTNDPTQPRYSQGVMSAPTGQTLLVEYSNPSAEPHNWVLVEPGQEQAVVDAAAAKDGDPAGIPGVIAWSETITGGSTTVEVPALTERTGYVYLCTVPGHYAAGHKGALDVH